MHDTSLEEFYAAVLSHAEKVGGDWDEYIRQCGVEGVRPFYDDHNYDPKRTFNEMREDALRV